MAASATIRVTPETRDRLNRISAARGISAGELVAELAAQVEERSLLDAMAAHYEQRANELEARAEHEAEVAAWDGTAGDGLGSSG